MTPARPDDRQLKARGNRGATLGIQHDDIDVVGVLKVTTQDGAHIARRDLPPPRECNLKRRFDRAAH
jgi:hypothetical protein